MGELPFALAPEAALGAWLREAEREMEPHRTAGTYRGFDGTETLFMTQSYSGRWSSYSSEHSEWVMPSSAS